MYFAWILTAVMAMMAQVALGFTIPEGQPEGVYEVQVLDDGTEHHVRVADIPTAPLHHRDITGNPQPQFNPPPLNGDMVVTCTPDGSELDHENTDLANAAIDAWCGAGTQVPNGNHHYAIVGCTIAYYCNLMQMVSDYESTCVAHERGVASKLISDQCGMYQSGHTRQHHGNENAGYIDVYGYKSQCADPKFDYCDTLRPGKVTPRWSLLKFLGIDRSSRRAAKRWRSHRAITPQKPKPLDPSRPSLTQLSDELIVLIINDLHGVSPQRVPVLALVSSLFYSSARYVQHREEVIVLGKQEQEVLYLKYLATAGLLSAIRTLHFSYSAGWPLETLDEYFPAALNELTRQMSGLCDVYWNYNKIPHSVIPIPVSLIQDLKQRPWVRLHTSVFQDSKNIDDSDIIPGINGAGRNPARQHALEHISNMVGSTNLYSFHAEVEFLSSSATQVTQRAMRRLKELLLSCPSLRKLSLDIHSPRPPACQNEGLPYHYCGLGLSNGEKLPTLHELEIIDYPWGRRAIPNTSSLDFGTIGYPGEGEEEDYWAQKCDWSQLRRLTLPNSLLARKITQKLTVLEEINFRHLHRFQNMNGWDERDTIQFLRDLSTTLESISIPNLPTLGTDALIRHGSRLRRLELLRSDHPYNDDCKDSAVCCEDLIRLRDGLPHLEELAIDIAKDGDDWPYASLDILASFLRLRNLKLTFGLASPETPDETPSPPHLTMASAESLFRYMRKHSSNHPPSLQRLHVSSLGEVYRNSRWAKHNSTSFLVHKSVDVGSGGAGGPQEITVSCIKLRKQLNEKIRRVIRGEAVPTAQEMSYINFRVALKGPMSEQQLKLMRETDRDPYDFARYEGDTPYTYLADAFEC